jgi:hypothetical protein
MSKTKQQTQMDNTVVNCMNKMFPSKTKVISANSYLENQKLVSKYLTDEMLNDLKMSYHNEDGKVKKCKFILSSIDKTKETFMTNSYGDWLEFTIRINKNDVLCIELTDCTQCFSETKLNYNEGHNWLSPGIFEILKSQIQQMTNYFGSSVYPNWK